MNWRLALDAAEDQTGGEVLLQEGVNDQHGQCTEEQLSCTAGTGVHHAQDLCVVAACGTDDGFEVDGDGAQIGLQGILHDVLHVDESAEPVVPVIDDGEQTDGGQGLQLHHVF